MEEQEKNIDAIFCFRCNANVEMLNTVIVVNAMVSYFDLIRQRVLFRGETRVYIDTTQESKISIPALSYMDECFSEFWTNYQTFEYHNGALTISGSGFGQKNPYVITVL